MFLFVSNPSFSFCQKVVRTYDLALKRIVDKSWYIEKICDNDSCWTLNEKHNRYFQLGESYDGRTGSWHKPTRFFEQSIHMTEYPTSPLEFMIISCQPIISFVDSDTHKNNVFAVWYGGYDPEQGELVFLSDSEFVINPLYGVRYYFKATNTPIGFYELYNIPEPKKSE